MKQTARERGERGESGREANATDSNPKPKPLSLPCLALRLVLGHSNLLEQVINLYALNADFCGLGTKAKSVWHVTEMRARGQSVLGSITPLTFPSDANTLSAQVLESALNMQCHRWEKDRQRERERNFCLWLTESDGSFPPSRSHFSIGTRVI